MHAEAQGLEYKQKVNNFADKISRPNFSEAGERRLVPFCPFLVPLTNIFKTENQFKALEAMAQQVKPEPVSSNAVNATATKLDKNPSKSRGSGSPFKCIGLGLTHQINSEKDEELTAGRHRIEELEAVAASRQKEVKFG